MPPPQLHYAPRLPMDRRRRLFHRWLTVFSLIAVAAVAALWFPIVWRQIQLRYWVHRCMGYMPPANQTVFDSATSTAIVAPEWVTFYGLLSPPGSLATTTLFLHERKTGNGKVRLIAINLQKSGQIDCKIFDPGDLFTPPHELPRYRYPDDSFDDMKFVRSLSVTAGIPDPHDASAFRINAVVDGQACAYDGVLFDEEGHLEIYSKSKAVH